MCQNQDENQIYIFLNYKSQYPKCPKGVLLNHIWELWSQRADVTVGSWEDAEGKARTASPKEVQSSEGAKHTMEDKMACQKSGD